MTPAPDPRPTPEPSSAPQWSLGVVVGVVCGVGLLVVALLAQLRHDALAAGQRSVEVYAQLVAEQMARALQAVDLRLETTASAVAAAAAAGGAQADAAERLLVTQVQAMPFIRAIYVIGPDGRVLLDSRPGVRGRNLEDRAYFRNQRDAPAPRFDIGLPVLARADGEWMITASRPLPGPAGEPRRFAGIVVAAIDPAYLESSWRGIALGEGGAIELLRRDATLMMRSPFEAALMGRPLPVDELQRRAIAEAGPSGPYTSPVDGLLRQVAFRPVAGYPDLVVIAGQTESAMLVAWTRLAALAAGLWAMFTVATVAISRRLHRTEAGLRASERDLATTLQCMGEAVIASDDRGVVVRMNRAAERMTGFAAAEALGLPLAEVFRLPGLPPADGPEAVQRGEGRMLARDGLERPVLYTVAPLPDGAGRVWLLADDSARSAAPRCTRCARARPATARCSRAARSRCGSTTARRSPSSTSTRPPAGTTAGTTRSSSS